ncbi:hypothetical protein EDD85DRAFT_950239 [Armillaria nabsnona]|nr:hypothetical protein EDD85DRAFT_950239 [Armillaria nabsnona]
MAGPEAAPKPQVSEPLGHGQHAGKVGWMKDALEAEKLDEFGKNKKASHSDGTGQNLDDNDDAEDSDFETENGGSESSDSEDSDGTVPNSELAEIMPSKIAPETVAGLKCKRPMHKVTIEDDEQVSTWSNSSAPHGNNYNDNRSEAQPSSSSTSTRKSRKASGKHNPIYYIYKKVTHGADGTQGGGRGVMVGYEEQLKHNLKPASVPMHRFYLILKARLDTNPQAIVSEEEIELATGRKVLNPSQATEYIKKLEVAAENIVHTFKKQAADAAGPWDQEKLKQLLAEWIVTCDQLFEEVDHKEF